jgi:peptidyl-prolyl cis-trans isomerase B (cyclophilin B)
MFPQQEFIVKRVAIILSLATGCLSLTSCGPSGPNPVVLIETSMGDMKVELFQDKAPITVANFLDYVDKKHYDGTIFHRVIRDFMIQGGGFTKDMKERKSTGQPIKNESHNGLQNKRGTVAMARTNEANSATDQFFVNVVDNDFLDKAGAKDGVGYAVFGKVIQGMDVADKIRQVKTGAQDVPVEPVIIKSIRRVDN